MACCPVESDGGFDRIDAGMIAMAGFRMRRFRQVTALAENRGTLLERRENEKMSAMNLNQFCPVSLGE